jgi:hemerythrin-like metal-binding protein
MEKAFWRDEYSVGVDQFDRQHRHLFEIIDKLYAHTHTPSDLKLVSQALKEMLDYAKEHFTDEEKLMQQYAYPELESQKKQHAYFLKTTAELIAYPPDRKEEGAGEIAEFLNIWWVIHILKWDMKYKEFFKQKLPTHAEAQTSSA